MPRPELLTRQFENDRWGQIFKFNDVRSFVCAGISLDHWKAVHQPGPALREDRGANTTHVNDNVRAARQVVSAAMLVLLLNSIAQCVFAHGAVLSDLGAHPLPSILTLKPSIWLTHRHGIVRLSPYYSRQHQSILKHVFPICVICVICVRPGYVSGEKAPSPICVDLRGCPLGVRIKSP